MNYLTVEENKIKVVPIYPPLYDYNEHIDLVDEVFTRHENFDFLLLELDIELPRRIFWEIVEGRWEGKKSIYYYLALYCAREINLKILERINGIRSEVKDLFSVVLEELQCKILYKFIIKQLSIQLFIKKLIRNFTFLQCPICWTSNFYKKTLADGKIRCKRCNYSLNGLINNPGVLKNLFNHSL